ncbi:putative UDP-glycosyltransferase 73C1-like [Sesbania bispinosa]|nr:putative UDP-glycosyltransferase 73C1-like [Sesbania bispinosa]
MAPGHILPMVDMAKLLPRHNVKVTIVTTPLNATPFRTSIDKEIKSGFPIQILLFRFPNTEAGIPEGCENLETLPSMDLKENFFKALDLMQQPLEELLAKLNPFPSCIISDKNIPCVADIAIKFKIYETLSDSDQFTVPGLPHRIEMRKSQLPVIFTPGPNQRLNDFRERVKEWQKVWCVGPVSLLNKEDMEKAQRGSKISNDATQYVEWLDSRPPSSVIYVCLGSLNRVTPEQLIELGLGLEATKRPFIWVLRGAYRRDEMEKWLLEDGFEERVKGRGILIRGWAPQVLILSHRAIGAF